MEPKTIPSGRLLLHLEWFNFTSWSAVKCHGPLSSDPRLSTRQRLGQRNRQRAKTYASMWWSRGESPPLFSSSICFYGSEGMLIVKNGTSFTLHALSLHHCFRCLRFSVELFWSRSSSMSSSWAWPVLWVCSLAWRHWHHCTWHWRSLLASAGNFSRCSTYQSPSICLTYSSLSTPCSLPSFSWFTSPCKKDKKKLVSPTLRDWKKKKKLKFPW